MPADTAVISFRPFYDRWLDDLPAPEVLKFLVSLVLGVIVFGMQYLSIGQLALQDWAWTLGAIAICAALSQYYATHTFRRMLTDIAARLNPAQTSHHVKQVEENLSDRHFVSYGVFFGAANTAMGALFGVPISYHGWWAVLCSYAEFFVVGFICGIPICGIKGVLRTVDSVASDETLRLDYTSPDGCGGTQTIGEALVRFAFVTLVTGVLIAWYILHVPWSRSSHTIVNMAMIFWVVFPFVMSLIVLILPAESIHHRLEALKAQQSALLEDQIRKIHEQIGHVALAEKEVLLKTYDHYVARRSLLYRMRTWPFDSLSQLKYASGIIFNVAIQGLNIAKHWPAVGGTLRIRLLDLFHGLR